MMKLKRVEEPQVSPDGKWVLFAAVDVDLAANTKTPHVWIVPTAGGQEKEIIADQDDRSSALVAGWKTVRIYLDKGKWLTGMDCGF